MTIDRETYADIASFIQERKATQGVTMHRGKRYTMVSDRVEAFRRFLPDWGIVTEIIHYSPTDDAAPIVIKAYIKDPTGRVVATGHSEEWRTKSKINETSSIEVGETSAIGRALAAMGIHGGEFASANEMEAAITKGETKAETKIKTLEVPGGIPKPLELKVPEVVTVHRDVPETPTNPPQRIDVDLTDYSLVVKAFETFVPTCGDEAELRQFWSRNPDAIKAMKAAGGDWYAQIETIFKNHLEALKKAKKESTNAR